MSSINRKRVIIEQPGKPRLYQPADMPGWEFVGTVQRGEGEGAGALVRNQSTGIYAQANAGAIRSLDQRKVLAALGSNASKMDDGKRRNVYMSDRDARYLKELGNGNLSEGIRVAVSKSRGH